MLKRYIWVIGAGLVLALASFYLGQRYYASKGHFLAQELNLSAGQKQQYQVLANSLQARQEALCNNLCAQRQQLHQLIAAVPLNKAKINSKLAEINKCQGEIEKETVSHICAVQDILNPEQKKKYLDLLNDKICQLNNESMGNQHYQDHAK